MWLSATKKNRINKAMYILIQLIRFADNNLIKSINEMFPINETSNLVLKTK